MLTQGFLRIEGQAKITKCYFLWVGAINMKSLSGRHLMHQQVPMVFLFPLIYLGAVAYISVEISLGSCWRRDILMVIDQVLITNCHFLWLCVICNDLVVTNRCAIKYPWCFYTSFSLSKCCYFHFWRKKFGPMLAQGYSKGERSSINQKLQLSVSWRNQHDPYELSSHYVMRSQVSMSFFFFFLLLLLYLITVACILDIYNLGSCWHKDECMGQRSTIHHNVQLCILQLDNEYAIIQWPLLDAPTKVPMVFLLLLVCLSTVCYDYIENSMCSCWRKDILRVKGLA